MIFNTWTYAVFLAVAFALYWAAPVRARGIVLAALGFFFYGYYYPPHVLGLPTSPGLLKPPIPELVD